MSSTEKKYKFLIMIHETVPDGIEPEEYIRERLTDTMAEEEIDWALDDVSEVTEADGE